MQERFDAVAKALLCDYYLVVEPDKDAKSTKLEIMELEFYVQKEGFHEDPFTHGSEEQKVAGRWYFHRAPRFSADSNRSSTGTSWRSGSRKGLDLTIGRFPPQGTEQAQSSSLLQGGILLRSIRVLGREPKVVSGPSLLVDQILSSSGVKEIGDLVNGKWGGDTSAFPPSSNPTTPGPAGSPTPPSPPAPTCTLRVIPKSQFGSSSSSSKPTGSWGFLGSKKQTVIYSSPRIGLELSHPGTTGPSVRPLHSRIRFLPRAYRYFREPELLVANGRPQTFVGALLHSAKIIGLSDLGAKALKNPRLIKDVCKIANFKEPLAQKYLNDFVDGGKGGEKLLEREFVGAKGKGAAGSPSSYLRMMGAVMAVVSHHQMELVEAEIEG
ncbi:hypothetical protein H1R20_g6057, partial [Candolleomyces eurysporus]